MGILLSARNVRVSFGIRTLFEIETLEIREKQKIGLIGPNGSGKSTLLSVLSGQRAPDSGEMDRRVPTAVIRQFGAEEDGRQEDEGLRARLGAAREAHEGISGGEMERLRIARALMTRAPLLLCDEPTNHLDFQGQKAAVEALKAYQGAMVLVSHDRALLDEMCEMLWVLEEGKLRFFPGNYSAYLKQREKEKQFAAFEYEQYRQEQQRLKNVISQVRQERQSLRKAPKRMGNSEARLMKRSTTEGGGRKLEARAAALQSRLEQLEVKERPCKEEPIRLSMSARSVASATTLRIQNLTLKAGGKILLEKARFSVPTGKRTALVGPNGCGKTTLLKAVCQKMDGVLLSPGVRLGYFGQETMDMLEEKKTLLENVMAGSVLAEHEARTLLDRMRLRAADMDKSAGVLSGGERAKAVLAKLMCSDHTFLVMDEPGNHLDIAALEALEEMLSAYEGTLLFVSHDQRMLEKCAQRILVFENQTILSFEGSWAEYSKPKEAEPSLEPMMLRMKMTEILSRLSAPRKGDDPAKLEEEYQNLVKILRAGEGNG